MTINYKQNNNYINYFSMKINFKFKKGTGKRDFLPNGFLARTIAGDKAGRLGAFFVRFREPT
jgi:hypothetical protein